MRAHCHKGDWDNLKRWFPVQQRQAQELHLEAGLAEGPCDM